MILKCKNHIHTQANSLRKNLKNILKTREKHVQLYIQSPTYQIKPKTCDNHLIFLILKREKKKVQILSNSLVEYSLQSCWVLWRESL